MVEITESEGVSIEYYLKFGYEKAEALFKCNSKDFLWRFINVDDIWIYHYIPETKHHLKQWVIRREPTLKKIKVVLMTRKVLTMFSGPDC